MPGASSRIGAGGEVEPFTPPARLALPPSRWRVARTTRAEAAANSAARRTGTSRPILISAWTGQGEDVLAAALEARLAAGRPVFEVTLPPADGSGLNWLYEHAEVLHREVGDTGTVRVTARVAAGRGEQLRHRFAADQLREIAVS